MKLQENVHKIQLFKNLELLAGQVVEGFINGMHKSPFHGFSSEFAEHKIYNPGESTRHIDWRLFAKTDRLYVKRYEEETNLRCHLIIDNSSSMHYPPVKVQDIDHLNKIGFASLAAAALMNLLKRQRDAVGLSVYSNTYEYYAPEKGSERHHRMLLDRLEKNLVSPNQEKTTRTYTYLHQIAEKIHRRSMIFLFTDMLQSETGEKELFEALRHLKYNKHEVIFFHVMDKEREFYFDFDDRPKRFVDMETGEHVNVYAHSVKNEYQQATQRFFEQLHLTCAQYGIKYVEADIAGGINRILLTYLIERQKFI